MGTDEVVGDLVNVESALQSCFALGAGRFVVSVGTSPKGAVTSAQGSILRFDMIGVDIARIQILRGFRMLPMRGFVFGTFASRLALLRPFVLQAYFHAFGKHLRWTAALTFPQGLGA